MISRYAQRKWIDLFVVGWFSLAGHWTQDDPWSLLPKSWSNRPPLLSSNFLFCFVFQDNVSRCSPCCSGTYSVQTRVVLNSQKSFCLYILSVEIKDVCHHTWLPMPPQQLPISQPQGLTVPPLFQRPNYGAIMSVELSVNILQCFI